ncbi:MAG: glycosyltransferase [Longimicrobiales bacterium]
MADPKPAPETPTHVLHLIDTGGPGGAETLLVNLVRSLPHGQWRSRVLVPREGWLLGQLLAHGIDARVVPTRGSADFAFLTRLVNQIRDFRPRLLHTHLLTSAVYGSMAATLAGNLPVVCTFHGSADVHPEDRMLGVKARILSRTGNSIVYVSHDLRAMLERRLGTRPDLGTVIHNGVSPPNPAHVADLRGELQLGPHGSLVGSVGNIRGPKDYPTLLRAARLVLDHGSDVHFVIAGDNTGPRGEAIAAFRRALGLDANVHFLGFRRDVAAVIGALDLFVSSSASEGLPLATLEAQFLGVPVVLTAVGGVPEIVEHGKTGVLVPPGNPGALAEGISRLLNDRRLAGRMAAEGRRRVEQGFSLEGMLERYIALYRTAITTAR